MCLHVCEHNNAKMFSCSLREGQIETEMTTLESSSGILHICSRICGSLQFDRKQNTFSLFWKIDLF